MLLALTIGVASLGLNLLALALSEVVEEITLQFR